MVLKLRYLWGAPKEWRFDDDDEAALRAMLRDLDEEFGADPESKQAVLVAKEDDGSLVGAWNRAGAARLASVIIFEPPSSLWIDVRNALENAVTGP